MTDKHHFYSVIFKKSFTMLFSTLYHCIPVTGPYTILMLWISLFSMGLIAFSIAQGFVGM